jgi:hypothetical protein
MTPIREQTKYHLRFLRTQVPACIMFPLVHLLCQISYQLEENFMLRKRDERGTVASVTLFNLTSDGIVRDSIFHDTKEAREKHILPVYHNKKEWHTAVLMTHFFRPPNSPAEDNNGQVQLLKVEQIIDQMTVWNLHRGGSIYLDLQMSRQQRKVKRTKSVMTRSSSSSSSRLLAKRKTPPPSTDASGRPTKRPNDGHSSSNHQDERPSSASSSSRTPVTSSNGHLDDQEMSDLAILLQCMAEEESSDEEDADMDGLDDSASATEVLSNMIVQRTLKRSPKSACRHRRWRFALFPRCRCHRRCGCHTCRQCSTTATPDANRFRLRLTTATPEFPSMGSIEPTTRRS